MGRYTAMIKMPLLPVGIAVLGLEENEPPLLVSYTAGMSNASIAGRFLVDLIGLQGNYT
jgi:hypothetical protein